MTSKDDFYRLLDVEKNATEKDILKAFRQKSLQYHPDKNPGFEELMVKLTQAKSTLLDPNCRANYDKDYEGTEEVIKGERTFLSSGVRYSELYRRKYTQWVQEFDNIFIVNNSEIVDKKLEEFQRRLIDAITTFPEDGVLQSDKKDKRLHHGNNEMDALFHYESMKKLFYEDDFIALAQYLRNNNCNSSVQRLFDELTTGREVSKMPNRFQAGLFLIKGAHAQMENNYEESLHHYQRVIICSPDEEFSIALSILLNSMHSKAACENLIISLSQDLSDMPRQQVYQDRLQATVILRTTQRYEKSVLTNDQLSPFEKAMLYIDLSMAAPHIIVIANNCITAATFLMKSMAEVKKAAHQYACHGLILDLIATVIFMTERYLDPSMGVHCLKQCYNLMLKSTAVIRATIGNRMNKRGAKIVNMINPLQEELLKQMNCNLCKLLKVCPLTDFPSSTSADAIFLELVGTNFLENFYEFQVSKRPEHPFNHLHHYYLFESKWKRGAETEELKSYRGRAMEALLKQKGWSLVDVEKLMKWPIINRDANGWWDTKHFGLKPSRRSTEEFYSAEGITVDLESGMFKLQLTEPPPGQPGLFNMEDIFMILTSGITSSFFTLDQADPELNLHPFQQMKYGPKSLKGTDYLRTLLHADYLLKMLSMGCEVSNKIPFDMRDSKDGLLGLLPEELRKVLTSFSERDNAQNSGQVHRFWIEAGECPFLIDQTDNKITFTLGYVPMKVRKHLMKYNSDGLLIDDSDSEDLSEEEYSETEGEYSNDEMSKKRTSAEKKFATEFTKYYDEFGGYFPVLLRLRELLKLGALCVLLRSVYRSREEAKKELRVGTKVTEMVQKVLDGLRVQVTYPLNTDGEVNRHYREVVRKNGYQESEISWSEAQETKRKIRTQLVEAEPKIVANITESLISSFEIHCDSSLSRNVKDWLSSGTKSRLITQLVGAITNREIEKLCRFSRNLESFNINFASEPKFELNEDNECSWVPSAYRKHSRTSVYGGVILNVNLVNRADGGSGGRGGEGSGRGGSGGGDKGSEHGGSGGGSGLKGRSGGSGSGGNGGVGEVGYGDDGEHGKENKRRSTEKKHKNKLDYVGTTCVYLIKNMETRKTNKVGISSVNIEFSDGKWICRRAERQAAKLEKETGQKHEVKVKAVYPNRLDAYDVETKFVDEVKKTSDGKAFPGNKKPVVPTKEMEDRYKQTLDPSTNTRRNCVIS